MSRAAPRRYELRAGGHDYVLEVAGSLRLTIVLRRDGAVIALKTSTGERIDAATDGGGTRVEVRATPLGRVRRATLRVGGHELDMDPVPGSPAARRLERERAHPVRYAVVDVLVAAAGVLVPLLGLGALVKVILAPVASWFAERMPHVDLPTIDLPDLPWPRIDLSWLPDWTPPEWLRSAVEAMSVVLDRIEYVWPLVVAALFSWGEVRRRRRQDELKARLAAEDRGDTGSALAGDAAEAADR